MTYVTKTPRGIIVSGPAERGKGGDEKEERQEHSFVKFLYDIRHLEYDIRHSYIRFSLIMGIVMRGNYPKKGVAEISVEEDVLRS